MIQVLNQHSAFQQTASSLSEKEQAQGATAGPRRPPAQGQGTEPKERTRGEGTARPESVAPVGLLGQSIEVPKELWLTWAGSVGS